MSRSKWKGPFLSKRLLVNSLKIPKIWSRDSSIPEFLIDKSALVYNGRSFIRVNIKRERLGFKFGMFSFTRKIGGNKKKKKLKKTK